MIPATAITGILVSNDQSLSDKLSHYYSLGPVAAYGMRFLQNGSILVDEVNSHNATAYNMKGTGWRGWAGGYSWKMSDASLCATGTVYMPYGLKSLNDSSAADTGEIFFPATLTMELFGSLSASNYCIQSAYLGGTARNMTYHDTIQYTIIFNHLPLYKAGSRNLYGTDYKLLWYHNMYNEPGIIQSRSGWFSPNYNGYFYASDPTYDGHNQWRQTTVTVYFDPSSNRGPLYKIYHNATLYKDNSASGSTKPQYWHMPRGNFQLGGYPFLASGYAGYEGLIDSIIYYDYALSAAAVSDLYSAQQAKALTFAINNDLLKPQYLKYVYCFVTQTTAQAKTNEMLAKYGISATAKGARILFDNRSFQKPDGNIAVNSVAVTNAGAGRGTWWSTAGRYYVEYELIRQCPSGDAVAVGLMDSLKAHYSPPEFGGQSFANSATFVYSQEGRVMNRSYTYGTAWGVGDRLGIAWDSNNGNFWVYKNGQQLITATGQPTYQSSIYAREMQPFLKFTDTIGGVIRVYIDSASWAYSPPGVLPVSGDVTGTTSTIMAYNPYIWLDFNQFRQNGNANYNIALDTDNFKWESAGAEDTATATGTGDWIVRTAGSPEYSLTVGITTLSPTSLKALADEDSQSFNSFLDIFSLTANNMAMYDGVSSTFVWLFHFKMRDDWEDTASGNEYVRTLFHAGQYGSNSFAGLCMQWRRTTAGGQNWEYIYQEKGTGNTLTSTSVIPASRHLNPGNHYILALRFLSEISYFAVEPLMVIQGSASAVSMGGQKSLGSYNPFAVSATDVTKITLMKRQIKSISAGYALVGQNWSRANLGHWLVYKRDLTYGQISDIGHSLLEQTGEPSGTASVAAGFNSFMYMETERIEEPVTAIHRNIPMWAINYMYHMNYDTPRNFFQDSGPRNNWFISDYNPELSSTTYPAYSVTSSIGINNNSQSPFSGVGYYDPVSFSTAGGRTILHVTWGANYEFWPQGHYQLWSNAANREFSEDDLDYSVGKSFECFMRGSLLDYTSATGSSAVSLHAKTLLSFNERGSFLQFPSTLISNTYYNTIQTKLFWADGYSAGAAGNPEPLWLTWTDHGFASPFNPQWQHVLIQVKKLEATNMGLLAVWIDGKRSEEEYTVNYMTNFPWVQAEGPFEIAEVRSLNLLPYNFYDVEIAVPQSQLYPQEGEFGVYNRSLIDGSAS